MEQTARERGALTAYVDEGVGNVPEAMAVISRECARQGTEFKKLDRALASYRERRHEAEAVAAGLDAAQDGPSPVTATVARAGLAGLGLIPGAGPFVGAVDPAQLAQYADRLRRGLSARFSSQDDVQLVLSPERALTPKLLDELTDVACAVPWIILFFDTYERTGPFLDGWLHDLMTTDDYGALPANVVVVTAGQHPFDRARWGGFADFMTEIPLGPFTEAEARGLLADRGVVAEPVVAEVLRLTGGLPLLVSTLAEQHPADLDDIGDPSATAVERFLKWEQDSDRRSVALACALPRGLDMDVFRAVVNCPEEEADALFGWLRRLPFVVDRGDRLRYHDLVREQMLRLLHRRSSRGWTERHTALVAVFGRWREEAADGVRPDELWEHETWRSLRLEETYHRLCARPRAELSGALRGVVEACWWELVDGRRWARMLEEAGAAADDAVLRDWGRRLRDELADDQQGVIKAVDLLLSRSGLDVSGRALARALRGRQLRRSGEYRQALAEYDQAVALGERASLSDADQVRLYFGRGVTRRLLGDLPAAMADLDRAEALSPDDVDILRARGETHRRADRFEEAVAEFDRALALVPTDTISLAGRALCRQELGRQDEALADFDRVVDLAGYYWALVGRALIRSERQEWDEAIADLDRAASLAPEEDWVAYQRGDAYRLAGRYEDAITELGRAVQLKPDYAGALASRGAAAHELGRYEDALADFDRALELEPDYAWALGHRAGCKLQLDDEEGMFADLRRAIEADPDLAWIHIELGEAYWRTHQYREALPFLHRALELEPDSDWALGLLGATHRGLRDYPEALQYLDRAVALNPEYGRALSQRAMAAMAVGRTELALADLDRCIALEPHVDWAWQQAVDLLMRCGRWPEALERLAEADRLGLPEEVLEEQRAEAYRHARQWAAARREGERIRQRDPLEGTFQLALSAGGSNGSIEARPLWQEVERLLSSADLEDPARVFVQCVVGCARDDWPVADAALTRLLADEQDWDDLAWLAALLAELMAAPGADRARMAPRLAAVEAARDAVQARYAE
ncbi:tetratricopeptide repeat protein [Streptomyces camelliae]|uniref:Tetratricopeptide repeat protein n=1 Tax=Streptomyces camelliae TaxID=3004093 RepID=A0ABY7P6W0_9ACTN|nr:tetratricopeptide repeat protein [Streptomyces sp. HUAS 2-6]WBO65654.1 tetratricopeptide repeat protein [Streptomyces sp. HUAS 2-6]